MREALVDLPDAELTELVHAADDARRPDRDAAAAPATHERGDADPADARVLLFVVMVTGIISSLGAPLIPSISDDLGVSLSSAQWSLTATLLSASSPRR